MAQRPVPHLSIDPDLSTWRVSTTPPSRLALRVRRVLDVTGLAVAARVLVPVLGPPLVGWLVLITGVLAVRHLLPAWAAWAGALAVGVAVLVGLLGWAARHTGGTTPAGARWLSDAYTPAERLWSPWVGPDGIRTRDLSGDVRRDLDRRDLGRRDLGGGER